MKRAGSGSGERSRCRLFVLQVTVLWILFTSRSFAQGFSGIESFDDRSFADTDDRTIGYDFTVRNRLVVTHLGYFDEGSDGLSYDHEVGIWSTEGELLTSVTVPAGVEALLLTPGGLPGGGYRYRPLLTYLTLDPGTYVIGGHYVAGSFDDVDRYPHDTVRNLITDSRVVLGTSRFSLSGTGFGFPPPLRKGGGLPPLIVNFVGGLSEKTRFTRGDVNADGSINLADVLDSIEALYPGFLLIPATGAVQSCFGALDTNSDGTHDGVDVLYLAQYVFGRGPPPPAPFPVCDFSSVIDESTCESFAACL